MSKALYAGNGDEAVPYWQHANPDVTGAFRNLVDASIHEIRANKSLEFASDSTRSVYFVMKGWLIVSKSTQDGHRQIIDFLMPGEVFDPATGCEIQTSTDLSALTDARLSVIKRKDWQRLLDQHPELHAMMDRRAAAGYSRIAERLLRVGQSNAEARIAYAICELCLRAFKLGLVDDEGFHLPLTQQVLGDFVGLSSVHVSRTFRRFERHGVLSYGDHMDIIIHDVDRLAEIAQIDPEALKVEILTGT